MIASDLNALKTTSAVRRHLVFVGGTSEPNGLTSIHGYCPVMPELGCCMAILCTSINYFAQFLAHAWNGHEASRHFV